MGISALGDKNDNVYNKFENAPPNAMISE